MSEQWKPVPENKPWAVLDETGYLIGTFREEHASLVAAAPDMYEALEKALQFITNGRELGYITMPDDNSGDTALETPNIIRKALAKAKGDPND